MKLKNRLVLGIIFGIATWVLLASKDYYGSGFLIGLIILIFFLLDGMNWIGGEIRKSDERATARREKAKEEEIAIEKRKDDILIEKRAQMEAEREFEKDIEKEREREKRAKHWEKIRKQNLPWGFR